MAFGPVNAGGGVSGPTLEAINGRIQAAQSAAETALQAHVSAQNPHNITVSQIGAVPEERKVNGKALSEDVTLSFSDLTGSVFHAGTTAPANKGLLWIDTTASTGGLKYFNGTAWVHVPVSTT